MLIQFSAWVDSGGAGVELLEPTCEDQPVRPRRRRRSNGPPLEPPQDGGGGGGGGGGGDDGESEKNEDSTLGHKKLGLALFLVSVATLFSMFLVVYGALSARAPTWPPPGFGGASAGLLLSTVLMLASDAALVKAERSRRRRDHVRMRRMYMATWILGVAFLFAQVSLWQLLRSNGLSISSNAYGTIFYCITGLHGLHIVGGLIYLTRVMWMARKREPAVQWVASAELCAVYWHSMGGLWLVLFGALYFLD